MVNVLITKEQETLGELNTEFNEALEVSKTARLVNDSGIVRAEADERLSAIEKLFRKSQSNLRTFLRKRKDLTTAIEFQIEEEQELASLDSDEEG